MKKILSFFESIIGCIVFVFLLIFNRKFNREFMGVFADEDK